MRFSVGCDLEFGSQIRPFYFACSWFFDSVCAEAGGKNND